MFFLWNISIELSSFLLLFIFFFSITLSPPSFMVSRFFDTYQSATTNAFQNSSFSVLWLMIIFLTWITFYFFFSSFFLWNKIHDRQPLNVIVSSRRMTLSDDIQKERGKERMNERKRKRERGESLSLKRWSQDVDPWGWGARVASSLSFSSVLSLLSLSPILSIFLFCKRGRRERRKNMELHPKTFFWRQPNVLAHHSLLFLVANLDPCFVKYKEKKEKER